MNESYVDAKAKKIFLNANGIVAEDAEGNPIDDLEVKTAKAFIESCCKKLRQKNTKISSYGLKHKAETWGKKMNELMNKKIFSDYVSNGAFIKGARELGFSIYPMKNTYDSNFKMSVKR